MNVVTEDIMPAIAAAMAVAAVNGKWFCFIHFMFCHRCNLEQQCKELANKATIHRCNDAYVYDHQHNRVAVTLSFNCVIFCKKKTFKRAKPIANFIYFWYFIKKNKQTKKKFKNQIIIIIEYRMHVVGQIQLNTHLS